MGLKTYNIGLILLVLWGSVSFVDAQHNRRSLEKYVRYNYQTSEKPHVFPQEQKIKFEGVDNAYRGTLIGTVKDSVLLRQGDRIRRFRRPRLLNISQTARPYIGLSKDYNANLDNNMQMFASPTAQTLEAGRVNLSAHYLLYYQGVVGLTDDFQVGVGFTLIPDFDNRASADNGQFLALTTKLKIRDRKHLDLAVGSTTVRTPKTVMDIELSNSSHLINYIYLTGSADYSRVNFSASIGQVYLGPLHSRLFFPAENFGYVATLAGSLMISDQLAIISENWWVNGIYNVPGVVNVPLRGVPNIPLIGGRYYTDLYGASLGLGNPLIPGVRLGDAIYIDGFYYF